MNTAKKIALFIATLGLLALGIYIYKRRENSVLVNLEGYEQDPIAATEMNSRNLSYYAQGNSGIDKNLILSLYEGFDIDTYNGVFPMYSESATLFTEAKRAENLAIAKKMIANYDSIVAEASRIHKVPRVLIYGVMLAEHERGVTLKQAESYSRPGSQYIGLMQISATTATDSLHRNITYKKLSNAQIDLFRKKGLVTGSDKNATVKVTSSQLRKVDINIHSGAEYLSRHINSWGIYQPEKIIVSYNQGEGALKRDGLTRSNPDAIYAYYKKQTSGQIIQVKGYLLKILGKHGACDILFNDLGIKD